MRAQEEASLTGNAWVERISYLRQLVSDQYDPRNGTGFNEFVDWLIDKSEEEFDSADEGIMRRKAQDMLQDGAMERVENDEKLANIARLIWYPWPNQWDHLAWIASAPVQEIVDWAETVEQAAQ
jgi:hypothetical protein